MSIKRINEFPEGSGVLSSDDVFLFMDDPSGNKTTKKVSLSELSDALGIIAVSGASADTGDITFSANVISTKNTDEDIILDPNGSGNVVIGTNKNLILDINAFTAEGIKIIDSTEDGYDDSGTPSTLRVGSIYHEQGSMVISSDGSIVDASGVQVDETGNPVDHAIYGGLWLTNGQDTGFLVPGPTGSLREYYFGSDVEIHNNEKIWEFTQAGNLNLPTSGNISLSNGTTLAVGTFDNGTGGQNGISLNCYVGYELNWQGGHLKSSPDGGTTTANIWCDSPIEFQGSGIDNVEINSNGITYADGTTQVTAPTVYDVLSGSNIDITSNSGIYTINHNGDASVIKTMVFNKTGSQIPKMRAVYINGGQGDMPTIALASYSAESTSSKTYGITTEAIDHMSSGIVVVGGALTGLDTDQFNPTAPTGDVNGITVWLATSGNLTTTKPSAPNHMVSLGTIVRTHQNEGVIEVKVQNGFEIEELHNVAISGVAHNDILVYNSGTSVWENKNNAIFSNPSGITGASAITNIVQISQADYNSLATVDSNTLYVIN